MAAPLLAIGLAGGRFDFSNRIPLLFSPILASVIELFVVWAWHMPALHHAARTSPSAELLEQGSYLFVGLLVWLAAFGGVLGAGVLTLLLRRGWMKPSFADYESYVQAGETLGDYPHARRECLREAWQIGLIVVGGVVGWVIGNRVEGVLLPDWLVALAAVGVGYLVGGAMVWGTRILGTFAFGREAMGLGDVHLLAAIGAVLGWADAVAVFLIAPFFGIAAAAISGLLAAGWLGGGLKEAGRRGREIPYGPHLALAAAFVVLGRPIVVEVRDTVLPPDVRERLAGEARFTASIGAGSMRSEVGMEPTTSKDGLPAGGISLGLAHGTMERMP